MDGGTEGRRDGGTEGGREGRREGGKEGGGARTDLVPPERVLVVTIHVLVEVKDDMGPVGDEEASLVVDLLVLQLLQLGHELRDVHHLQREGGREGGREV